MQPLRGTKDILPDEVKLWQYIYSKAEYLLRLSNYQEIRTPIIESTYLFNKSIGNDTDIINKEMYNFQDQGYRDITLRPEGTAPVARAFISNQMYNDKRLKRLWYLGPMFRYERPQQGRQRQFHQLGIECLGSFNHLADVEVIRLAINFLQSLQLKHYYLEINSIGNIEERMIYKEELMDYLKRYIQDLDKDSQKRVYTNPLRILDTKDDKTKEILSTAPQLNSYLKSNSLNHFHKLCQSLNDLNIEFNINKYLVRGLDYYNYTAFEIKNTSSSQQNTICGGGRYDTLIHNLGGPETPAVGWAIGIERLIMDIRNTVHLQTNIPIYIALQGYEAQQKIWAIIKILEKHKICFELDLSNSNFNKKIKKASSIKSEICLIIGEEEIKYNYVIFKWLNTRQQRNINLNDFENYLYYIRNFIQT